MNGSTVAIPNGPRSLALGATAGAVIAPAILFHWAFAGVPAVVNTALSIANRAGLMRHRQHPIPQRNPSKDYNGQWSIPQGNPGYPIEQRTSRPSNVRTPSIGAARELAACPESRREMMSETAPEPKRRVEIVLECRGDGGLRVWSPDIPGMVLSHRDPELLGADIISTLRIFAPALFDNL